MSNIVLSFILFTFSSILMAGNERGSGGGDIVYCTDFTKEFCPELEKINKKIEALNIQKDTAPDRPFTIEESANLLKQKEEANIKCNGIFGINYLKGAYSLDYLQTHPLKRITLVNDTSPYEVSNLSCEQIVDKVAKNLYEHGHPVLAHGLSGFLESFQNRDGKYHNRRAWRSCEGEGCLNNIADEGASNVTKKKSDLHYKNPANCKKIEQFVRKRVEKGRNNELLFSYYINETALRDLKNTNPEQCSYALIHEWMRDFKNDADIIYALTRSMHESKIDSEQLKLQFDDAFLNTPDKVIHCINCNKGTGQAVKSNWNLFKKLNKKLLDKIILDKVFNVK